MDRDPIWHSDIDALTTLRKKPLSQAHRFVLGERSAITYFGYTASGIKNGAGRAYYLTYTVRYRDTKLKDFE